MGEVEDSRLIFLREYVERTLKLKADKWQKLVSVEETKQLLTDFFEKCDYRQLVISANSTGALAATYAFPSGQKTKAVYFIKKSQKEPISKDKVKSSLFVGDLSHLPLEQFSSLVEEILVPLLRNDFNQKCWPQVVSQDVLRHIHSLKNRVFVVSGQVRGKTLLPLPVGTDRVDKAVHVAKTSGEIYDRGLIHAIETVVIDWTHQIRDVLKRDSSQPLLEGLDPGPHVEVEFWKAKCKNLQCIYEQLRTPKVRKMAELLNTMQSSYFPSFRSMFRDVVGALAEAQDVSLYLTPLARHFDDLEQADFADVVPLLRPMMHVICLVWSRSRYYCTPGRVVVLLQEICNLLIAQARAYLDPAEIFKGEIDESLQKVTTCLTIFAAFRATYDEHKAAIATYFGDDRPAKTWEFAPALVFTRMDKFTERLQTIRILFETAQEFMKLEKVEMGGIKGRSLGAQVVCIFEEFQGHYAGFALRTYDALDPLCREFIDDYSVFMNHIYDLDRRLGSIICQGYDDCTGTEGVFKMLTCFGTLLDRPIIKEEFEAKYQLLMRTIDEDLDTAKLIYDEHMSLAKKGRAPINKNMPPVAGALKWASELRERITAPVASFRALEHAVAASQAGRLVYHKCDEMLALLAAYETRVYSEWAGAVGDKAEFNLQQPLVTRNADTRLVAVNFDPQLVAVLREVKYLEAMKRTDIPEGAATLYKRNGELYQYVANLNLTVGWYNKIRETTLPVEFQLVLSELEAIDQLLQQAEGELNWNSANLWDYIQDVQAQVRGLESRLQQAKDNVVCVHAVMATWCRQPLFEKKEKKRDSLLSLEDRQERARRRNADVAAAGERINALLAENAALYRADTASQDWQRYVEHVDEVITDGFFGAIHCSMSYLLDNTDHEQPLTPLFEAQLELQAPELVFSPSLVYGREHSLYAIIDDLLRDVFAMASYIARVARHLGHDNYQMELEDMEELSDMRQEVIDRVQAAVGKAIDFRNSFDNYSYLWVEDRAEFMRQFLLYGHVITPEELENAGEEGVPENPPQLSHFKEQIDSYEAIYTEVEGIDNTAVFDGWFRVDIRPFKQALLNVIKRWSLMFKQHLVDHVTQSLTGLQEFIRVANAGLTLHVEEGDYAGMVDVMGHLMRVRDRSATTDEMFEPLKHTIELLSSYNQELSDDVHSQLHELPEQWNNTKKIAVTIKQHMAPLQANEVAILRRKSANFDVRQHEFREKYRVNAIFRYDCGDTYPRLDRAHAEITAMEGEMAALAESASLFEVNLPEFKQLKQCRRELLLLKLLWDYAMIVRSSIDDWKTTLWADIDVEQMEMDCKKFAKDIRGLDKECRAWDAYGGLEDTVKNMLTSLRAVGELQNPAIRERHWQELMHAAKVKFVMSDTTNLSDLLALNLHNFEDEVLGIVDKSVKEMAMEKTLKELDVTWASMEFEHELHARTKCKLLRSSEELIETLEDNQVQLQNLMTSKYIGHFLEEVSGWQKKLSMADQVISIWFEVQRTWSHLESIFIGSEDIRCQLPEDSKRFDSVDAEFKELLCAMENTTNVVAGTNRDGLFEKLEVLQSQLTLCEKALAEYLETKRLAFPRFYFVSSADLLDILSNGNQPELVAKHLSKLFDSMARLKFLEDEDGNLTKTALGMYSKEDEYVDFDRPCECTGQVEAWLNRLMRAMCSTVRHYMADGVVTYEEKPREQWLFDYMAQVALCGTQIWWTTEVGIAFGRLEEGYENALKDYYKKQVQQLVTLINLLIGELTKGDRQKIMTICTIDVHARDVVAKLIQQKVEMAGAFLWQSQLRHRWDEKDKDCFANICDAQFRYSHEYLGNTPRLVITPLTDRCYITLTQSLHLIMGGAPAGPAGTGKTETTKDLGRALGIMVYVFNCSEQMDYKSCGNIYKGLAQTGAWGCFDEFNRISVEVLSVVAVQVKCVQDAIRDRKQRFDFLGEDISLIPTVGVFITMNPGYAGRTELPENLKALFRPCAMVVPDFELISEIMLVAEGFVEARLLARKFITLYTLCKELLSKQEHYDWGLRAIKSVLVVAGSLKRSDKGRPEDQVLMRALRDFNIPKIVTDDVPIFMGLIGDLFPALDVPRKRDAELEKMVKQSTIDLKLQPEEGFILKVIQLQELLQVRHSVFVIGIAGTGKTQVWKTLFKTYQNQRLRPVVTDLNPKTVTNDELFGIINPSTREWKDGLFSVIMRDQAGIAHDGPKWILLDGDIDPMWIESLNTVMDDNKVLTLASNERIALTPHMRLIFEISNLRTATPATVSRAGILYINPADLGWNPYVASWIETRDVHSEKANLMILFDKYVPTCLETMRTRFKKITPIAEVSHIQMLCYLLDVLLTPENTPADSSKDVYELYFTFACVWAFGGSMFQDQLVDYRVEFSKWWTSDFKTVKFPSQGTVFDYYIDPETKKFAPWTEKVPKFELDPDVPLQAALVHTAETTRIRFFLDLLAEKRRPVMLVGPAGTGKTVLIGDKLLDVGDDYMVANVPFNFYTTSEMLQRVLEKPLEKKAGRNYGPPGTKRLVYFIDDMNMPEVDAYGTVQPHTLIRQHLDYSHWYDRTKLSLKEIHNCQYVACMNPTAGSFTINPRLQRHFCVFAVSFPGVDALHTVYNSILTQHMSYQSFPAAVQKIGSTLVNAALALHQKVSQVFLPTAIKFHYIFNLRDLSNIFQGMLFSTPDCVKTPVTSAAVDALESQRVYGDKLIDDSDMSNFQKQQLEIASKFFEALTEVLSSEPAASTVTSRAASAEPKYGAGVELSWRRAESHAHPAYISGIEVFQITLRKGYSIVDLKADIAALYIKAGLKNIGIMFLMTDAQVASEKYLVLINDLLASGEIADLLPDDDLENVISGIRNEVKAAGIMDTRDNCWRFFIDRVRRMLKVVLCFSPVGVTLRVRARKFPAIVNSTAINWFHEWPQEALMSVSMRFVGEIEMLSGDVRESISSFMAYVHTSVNNLSKVYLANDRRYNYTTPKSFLEQIKLYENLLAKKHRELQGKIDRLESGLEKLRNTASQVDDLKAKLAAQEVELKQKNEDADKLIQVVAIETEKVSKEKAIADVEEKKVAVIAKEVGQKASDCERDLAKAEPALAAAQEALNTLNKNNLTELKSFGSPPAVVVSVGAAVMCLLAPGGKVSKDRSWKAAKVMMAKVDQFLDSLITYDKENIHESCLKAVAPYLADPDFTYEFVSGKSMAAAGLCSWVVNIVRFYTVYCDVEPKRLALNTANAELAAAQEKLSSIKKKLQELEETLQNLTSQFERATAEKLRCQQEADSTNRTISLANRLVGGLASENVRWAESVAEYREQEKTLPGDVLLVTAFVSYVGCFTRRYRLQMMNDMWLPFLRAQKNPIPITSDLDPLSMLTDDADVAGWNNEGLPSDRMSTENATILTNSERWPLMIDPQLQGVKWIKTKYGEALRTIRLGSRGYLDVIEAALSSGDVVLIENIGESVDAVLDPLLGRNTIKKGRAIRMGDKEVEYNANFRLILHTKLANPHYKPEMQAQTTLINFTVTRDGLEDQLLAEVVSKERPDLERLKSDLTKQQNDFKIVLKTLEDSLLSRLSAAEGNFLGDTALVENLETTKKTAAEIERKVAEAKTTEVEINTARELYRPAAAKASLLYFILNDLNKINPIYQFSLKAFSVVFQKAIERAEPSDDVRQRVVNLIDCITYSVFVYTTRGLFECDKLIFTAQMAFLVLIMNREIAPAELDFLLRFPVVVNVTSPVDFLPNHGWGGVKALSALEDFRNLDRDIEGSAKRWKKFAESECPEKEKFPQEWKNKTSLQKLCIMRALRPDRMTYAVRNFIEEKMGAKYVEGRQVEFAKSYEESGPATPVFFILSPGVDPLKDVEALGKKLGFTFDNKNFHNVSLGQGQEVVAEQAMEVAAKDGHWVILQNVHLVAKWLPMLEKLLERYSVGSHESFRVYMSAEPAGTPDAHIIPSGILETSIKITNEPPTGMHANLHKALDNFTQDTLEMCAREAEFKSILFSLCYFHAVVAERRKFGPQGWNRVYPFNTGDLTISVNVLYNYLEANPKVPWEDLRYLFGEIMYGGHITDDWDRRLCKTYLEEYTHPDQLEGELYLAPGFAVPPNSDYKGYHLYIDEYLPAESPYLYGLHPNAEIGFLTTTCENLFKTLFEMQPRDSGAGGGAGVTREEKVKATLDEILEKLPEEFNLAEIMSKAEERTPYVVVAFQECERMNTLTAEMRRSLRELDLGLKGELTITNDMEDLSNSLYFDQVPASWTKRAYPSMHTLAAWYADLLLRIKELENWTTDFQLPVSVWLAGFFNPQSFLTAIMQSMARKNEWPLDRMCLQCDVTKKNKEDFTSAPREGSYVHGLFMEGARWDTQSGMITDSRLKEMFPAMPVMFIRAIPVDKVDSRNVYECPVYKTRQRGPTYIWTFNLKTKEKPARWVLAGVALLLQV
ncbi:PREDICTED: LOW QUALITY PROTEIN: dynein beta chain, ciliary-like [Priapulus caudatus]|uniref:LOW QUALITY PROTEIN: dynein beta chain, ciliary-like n=1 Tax=Priapulus caudatus TaxID=37621 RepID=A0ABM1E8E9_PRICU|nr:PREDICTED: LOW QUALITY PROTEIN: dynein beta chain, ciliary-like [Priapulus caudatus]